MKSLLLITTLIVSCGTDPKALLPVETQSAEEKAEIEAAKDVVKAKERGVEIDPDDQYYGAELVETSDELDVCSEAFYKQLVYVTEEKTFYYCSQANKWLSIDLRGAKGDQGIQGVQGIQGAAGRDGKDAVSVGSNEWMDPVTNEKWFVGQFTKPWEIARSQATCPAGSRAPTLVEMTEADQRGIFAKLRVANQILIAQTELIVRAEQESTGSWLVHYMTLTAVPKALNSKRVTQADYDNGGSTIANYNAFWQFPYYTICKIPAQ